MLVELVDNTIEHRKGVSQMEQLVGRVTRHVD
jgi:hypothetical protein